MRKFCLLSLLILCGVFTAPDSRAADWSTWRGPQWNGTSGDTNLPDTWSSDPAAKDNNLVWRSDIGGSTTPIVQNGRIYFLTRTGEEQNVTLQERVVCLDEKTGKLLWQHKYNVFFTDVVGDRLGWLAMAGDPETGYVYAHGTQGFLMCFDKDGKLIWQHSLTEEYGRVTGYGGRSSSPIVDGDLLLFSMANSSWGDQAMGRTRFVAFDKRNGAVVWWASTGFKVKNSYASVPVVATINGERLVIGGGGDGGVHAFQVKTGKKLWSYLFSEAEVNISPVIDGNRIYIGHGDVNLVGDLQGSVICLDGSKVKDGKPALIWKRDGIKAKFASPVFDKAHNRLYICDEAGFLYCLNGDDGTQIWKFKYGRSTKGSPVLADGKIYIGEVDNAFYILKPGDKKCELLHKEEFAGGDEIVGSAAVVNGHVYFMTADNTYCIGKKDGHAATPPTPSPAPTDERVAPGSKPATLQIRSADVVVLPGESVELHALAYDATGVLLGPVKVDWSLAGPLLPEGVKAPPGSQPPPPLKGELSAASGEKTTLTVAKMPPGQFGRVLAKLGDLTAEARVRVAPTLPLVADFSKVPLKRIPGGWVNTQGKFEIVKLEDKQVLMKTAVNPSPLVARGRGYITVPSASDYTIEADIRGGKVGKDLPDMGLVNCRYTLMLVGNNQQLRLVSWNPVPRIDKSIIFKWEPDIWYRMKLTVAVQGDKATVRGKVWPRDKPEPKEWTVEVTDPLANKEGSPALYGNALAVESAEKPGTPIYYDNVKVTPNK